MYNSSRGNPEVMKLTSRLNTAIEHKVRLICLMLNVNKKPADAIAVFKEWKAKNIPRTEMVYSLVADALQQNSDVRTLDALVKSMKRDNVKATDIFYGKIISAYTFCKAYDKVGDNRSIPLPAWNSLLLRFAKFSSTWTRPT